MEIIPLASDSLGVRSMATYVKTKDVSFTIDPSAALGPKRYRLPPTQKEIATLKKFKELIRKHALKSDGLIISHYHYDHFDPNETFYHDKTVYVKNTSNYINKSQKKRGTDFRKKIKDLCQLKNADDSSYTYNDTTVSFSPPFFHGPENVRLGYVIITTIKDKTTTLVHASDVQGPVTKNATDYIIDQQPDVLIMDGPPTYFLGWRFSEENLEKAAYYLTKILEKTECNVILDHHLLRDKQYKKRFNLPYRKFNDSINTFAEYRGEKNNTLEAYRKIIWGDEHRLKK